MDLVQNIRTVAAEDSHVASVVNVSAQMSTITALLHVNSAQNAKDGFTNLQDITLSIVRGHRHL